VSERRNVPDPDLVERLDGIARRTLTASTFRHVSVGRQPLSGEGARIQGGRWNPPESFPTLYVGLTAEVAIAEFHRLALRAGRGAQDFLPRELHRVDVTLEDVLELADAPVLKNLGIEPSQLLGDDLRTSQALGDAAHYLGIEAVLSASAAGPGHALAIFTDRLMPGSALSSQLVTVWDVPPHPG
jgi:RES domain-containing protein